MNKFAAILELAEAYELLSIADHVYGPYTKSDGRQIVIVDGYTVSYPKYILEQHLGRKLNKDLETVDHLDFNYMNNDLSNLRIVPRDEHSADDTRRVKLIKFVCPMCDKEFERSPRLVRDKAKKNNSGPFCSRQCSGRYSRMQQLNQIDKLPAQTHIESEYYRKKNVLAFVEYIETKYNF